MVDKHAEKIISVASVAAPKLDLYSIQNNGEKIYVYDACIIRLLSQAFRVPFKILLPSDGEAGTNLPDGNWTGTMGMVHRSEVDIGSSIGINYPRSQAVNISYPYRFSEYTFMTDKLKPVPTILALLHPFPLLLWILIIAIIFLFSFVLFIHVYRKETYQNILFMLFGSLLEKSINMRLRKLSVKFLLNTWFIFIFVIVNSYKAVLLAILTLPSLTGIKNIPDLAKAAEQKSVTCYSYRGTSLEQIFLESEFVTWRSIGKCMQRNVINTEDAVATFIKASPNKAFISAGTYLRPYEEMYFISEDMFFNSMAAFSVSKNFCCKSYLDEKIHRLFAAGLFQKSDKDEQFILKLKADFDSSDFNEPGKLKILQLEDLKGAFIILFSGYVLSTIVLFIEIAIKHYFPKSKVTLMKIRRKMLKKK